MKRSLDLSSGLIILALLALDDPRGGARFNPAASVKVFQIRQTLDKRERGLYIVRDDDGGRHPS